MKFLKYGALGFIGLVILCLVVVLASIPLSKMERASDLPLANNDLPILIDNVSIVPMTGEGVLRNRQILIENGRIIAINAAGAPAPERAVYHDGKGSFVMPGLIDTHVHIYDRKYLLLTLSHGITSVRNMGGMPFHLQWREELKNGEWLGSSLFTSSPILNGSNYADPIMHKTADTPEEARARVKKYAEDGYDLIKTYSFLSPEAFSEIREAADVYGIPVAGHVPHPVAKENYAMAKGFSSIEHAEEIYQTILNYENSDVAIAEAVNTVKQTGSIYVPTMAIVEHLVSIAVDKDDFLKTQNTDFMNPIVRSVEKDGSVSFWYNADKELVESNVRRFETLYKIVAEMHKQEVPMALGSDAGVMYLNPGVGAHEEIRLMVKSGVPNYKVLEAATINGAKVLGREKDLGSVEVGKIADLILVEDNPIDYPLALRFPRAVIKNGQFINGNQLQEMEEIAQIPAGFYFSMGRVLEHVLGE